jgi:hypothetical protein
LKIFGRVKYEWNYSRMFTFSASRLRSTELSVCVCSRTGVAVSTTSEVGRVSSQKMRSSPIKMARKEQKIF